MAGGEPKSTECCVPQGMPGMQTVLRHQEKSFRLQLHQEIFRNCSSSLVRVQAFYAMLWKRVLKDSCQLTKMRRTMQRDFIWHLVFTHTLSRTATQECWAVVTGLKNCGGEFHLIITR